MYRGHRRSGRIDVAVPLLSAVIAGQRLVDRRQLLTRRLRSVEKQRFLPSDFAAVGPVTAKQLLADMKTHRPHLANAEFQPHDDILNFRGLCGHCLIGCSG